ncbi:MAG: hypothetical protein ABI135_01085 [Rhodoferax sp.]
MTLQNLPPLPEELQQALSDGKDLCQWIAERQNNIEIPPQGASLVSGLLFDLAIEHHVGIVHLASAQINGPTFALLRAAMEALVRGAWLQRCATPEQVEAFVANETLRLNFGELVNAVEAHVEFSDKALSQLKLNSWTAMNSYAHGGMLQLGRRIKGGTIQPNFSPGEVVEVLKASGTFALFALRQIAFLAEHEALFREVDERLVGGK